MDTVIQSVFWELSRDNLSCPLSDSGIFFFEKGMLYFSEKVYVCIHASVLVCILVGIIAV